MKLELENELSLSRPIQSNCVLPSRAIFFMDSAMFFTPISHFCNNFSSLRFFPVGDVGRRCSSKGSINEDGRKTISKIALG